MVCGRVFVVSMIEAMLGLPTKTKPLAQAPLAAPLPANGPRQHYMRAIWRGADVQAFDSQDSSLLSVLAQAEALIVRPPNDPAREAGSLVEYLPL
jgi:molybdopterin molybdotransferase